MTNDQIDIFIKVADNGSFTKAEEGMHITKQAMLKQIDHLEEELGFRLFMRSRKGVRLTEAGVLFRKGILKLRREMEKLITDCRELDPSSHVIRIGNVEHQALLTPVNREFSLRYPNIILKQTLHPNHSGEWRVANDVQDVAETFSLAYRNLENLFSYQPLIRVPYMAVMRPTHPLAGKKQLGFHELAAYPTAFFPIMHEKERAAAIREAFVDMEENLIELHDVDRQVQAVYECLESDRILITANPFIEQIREIRKIPLECGWEREYGIIYKEPMTAAVRKYVETARDVYREKQSSFAE